MPTRPCSVEKINMRCYGPKPDWFMQMVPSGLLPVIEVSRSRSYSTINLPFVVRGDVRCCLEH